MKYKNETHRLIIESIKEAGETPRYPIMLTADQYGKAYTVSLNFTGTSIHIPKESINISDIREINEDDEHRIILNRVWEAHF